MLLFSKKTAAKLQTSIQPHAFDNTRTCANLPSWESNLSSATSARVSMRIICQSTWHNDVWLILIQQEEKLLVTVHNSRSFCSWGFLWVWSYLIFVTHTSAAKCSGLKYQICTNVWAKNSTNAARKYDTKRTFWNDSTACIKLAPDLPDHSFDAPYV